MSRLLPYPRRATAEPVDEVEEAIAETLQDDAALTDPVIAAEDRRRAQQGRQRAVQARAEADTTLTEAREQARRLVTEAEARARTLTGAAKADEDTAEQLEQHARMVDRAQELTGMAADAEQHITDLADEYATLTARAQELGARLADLGRQREDATAGLTAARELGDVAAVTTARITMSAIDEIAAVATAQLEAAQARAQAIGEAGWGAEYDQAVGTAAGLRQELSDLLDDLDPARATRRVVLTMEDYTRALVAAGAPEDEARETAAFLVAFMQYPEAAAAYFAELKQPASGSRVEVLRTASGAQAARVFPAR